MSELRPFHLAIPVKEIVETRKFYGEVMGCEEGRSSDRWVDFNFYGHQLVIHQVDVDDAEDNSNPVDGHAVPVPHFGIVLEWEDWQSLADRMRDHGTHFIIEPYVRFEGEPGEQATMFFKDPSGNALEFKSFKDMGQLFAT
ncbi:MAG: VOC family protein [Bacteroidota bacterium]